MKIKCLDHLVLTVVNIEKTVDFYTRVLGMQKEVFAGGSCGTHVWPAENQPASVRQ